MARNELPLDELGVHTHRTHKLANNTQILCALLEVGKTGLQVCIDSLARKPRTEGQLILARNQLLVSFHLHTDPSQFFLTSNTNVTPQGIVLPVWVLHTAGSLRAAIPKGILISFCVLRGRIFTDTKFLQSICHILLVVTKLPCAGVRDYIHVVDLALGHVAALNKLKEKCGRKVRLMRLFRPGRLTGPQESCTCVVVENSHPANLQAGHPPPNMHTDCDCAQTGDDHVTGST